jgi:hypothetical protein
MHSRRRNLAVRGADPGSLFATGRLHTIEPSPGIQVTVIVSYSSLAALSVAT